MQHTPRTSRILYLALFLLLVLSSCGSASTTSPSTKNAPPPRSGNNNTSLSGITIPSGFQISTYAQGLNTPRFMTIGPKGVLLVANRGDNSIVAIPPSSSPTQGGNPITIVSNLDSPSSLVMHDGYLYVGEGSSIARMALGDDLKAGPITRIITGLPEGGQHNTRTVLIGPDNRIYVSIGSSCNVCIEQNPYRASVWVYNLDGTQGRLFAKGLRNAVGLATNPWLNQVWTVVNGRDLMGDNTPPETLYTLVDQGDYGWPRCHAGTIVDPDFGQAPNPCQGVQQPLLDMQAHSAPLGLDFYPTKATQFPESYRNSLYIAFHGSWNRTAPTGYKVVRVPLHDGKVAGPAEDFITGWLQSDGSVSGRPVGVTFAPDGTLFVSDDKNGIIYHLWYKG